MKTKDAYREFLKSDFWRKLTKLKKETVGHCERCGSRRCLQSHHRFYRDDWFQTQESDLEVLCRTCHKKHHKRPGKEPKKKKDKLAIAVAEMAAGNPSYKSLQRLRTKNLIDHATFLRLAAPFVKEQKAMKVRVKAKREHFWHAGIYEGLTPQQVFQQIGKR